MQRRRQPASLADHRAGSARGSGRHKNARGRAGTCGHGRGAKLRRCGAANVCRLLAVPDRRQRAKPGKGTRLRGKKPGLRTCETRLCTPCPFRPNIAAAGLLASARYPAPRALRFPERRRPTRKAPFFFWPCALTSQRPRHCRGKRRHRGALHGRSRWHGPLVGHSKIDVGAEHGPLKPGVRQLRWPSPPLSAIFRRTTSAERQDPCLALLSRSGCP